MMLFASWPWPIRKNGLPLIVLANLALAGCSGGFGTSPFMEVFLEMEDSKACRHIWHPTPPGPVDLEKLEACENNWMRNSIEGALLRKFPLGSDVRRIVRYLEWEDFTCKRIDSAESENNTSSYECFFDSIEQNYGPWFVLYLPRYPYEMKWIVTIYYDSWKIRRLKYWNELTEQRR